MRIKRKKKSKTKRNYPIVTIQPGPTGECYQLKNVSDVSISRQPITLDPFSLQPITRRTKGPVRVSITFLATEELVFW